ncbi:hypothetical protein AAZX31_04G070100 [Glycine max]|uniref:TFIIS central domain-containing protein n=4 Tax=Glycine subgen. Soja TaxID=1462606 RepID=K7KIN2_SOYBN|nr:uncharacterized protein LOC100791982 isoform X2 [Glycine max]XP_028228083.1 uncharacterized protein LOC114409010 isoform X2 [Glycine soja]KAG5065580.1 hypothetical protein JHK86_009311 [Glycine max]KAH1110039.1 hypothetical protein GYH30_009100 [Glycine max]KRH61856.1 hypothetical protein GLYMA_04G071900v4 [Glycine max]RZC15463.1 PHD finger protein 3 isoform B [Glycine soja]|eukprot:XP_003523705.2 uncharacterized protein LOC100791982 isoform X2 [Glycine max]
MQMAQLEPLMNKVDSSGRQVEMGLLGPVSSDVIVSQSQGTSNEHVGLLRAVPGEASNPGMHQILSANKHSMLMDILPNSSGPQQQPTTPKRKAPMELLSSSSFNKRVAQMGSRPWLQQVPNVSNKGSLQMQSPSHASRTQHLAASSKRKTQLDNTPSKSGTPRSMSSKSQNTQMKQSSKVQTESSDSVRSKMRESLASALALVCQQGKLQLPNNNTPNDAANSQGKLENSSQCAGSAPASIDASLEQRKDISQSVNSSFADADSVGNVVGEHMQSTAYEDFPEKYKDYEAGPTNTSNNESILSSMHVLNRDKQDFQSSYFLTTDAVSFSDGFFMKDDLLQGNGLSWVLSDMVDVGNQRESQINIEQRSEPEESGGGCRVEVPLPKLLASRIEAELFKLFGGVNKKYKEKGRSLLFNLKDHNNPELRERVMFGKIPPEQLCSMTAEELASKELSQWRIAKAEELAQMVVLPDSDVDFRRLVKKTHKGEFQVEVEHEDNVPVEEVSGGTTSVAQSQTIKKDVEDASPSKPDVNTDGEKGNLQKDDTFSITISSNDGADPMQGLMTDDALKDPDFLPPIVSLDEFMESLHSEPPFENLPVESGKVTPTSDKDDSGVGSKSKSADLTPNEQADVNADNKSEKFQSTRVNSDAEKEKKINAESGAISSDAGYCGSQADMKSTDGHTKERSTDDVKSASSDAELRGNQFHLEERYGNNNRYSKDAVLTKGECLWEGMLQPNISSTHSVVSIFKSGEKTAAEDWPGFLEIKGRVRCDAFEKFLQDLRQSRSRAIMVSHFVSKESDDQSTLSEVADSYVLDERVGFAEPAPGVELYFCPPHNKTVEMLCNIIPKEQIEEVNSIDNGLIGIIVWRKTNLTSSISPTTESHHKHSSKRQYFSRRQQDINMNANSTLKAVPSMGVKMTENDDDDVPPGFGPPVAQVEDDLSEFSFCSNPSHLGQKPMGSSNVVPLHPVNPAPPCPAEQMRELVHKYGQNKPNVPSINWQDKFGGTIQPWNDDDDDIPEWQPQNSQNQFPPQQTMHNFHLRPHILNQSFPGSQQQPIMTPQYLQPPMNVTHGQRNFDPQGVPSPQGSNLQPRGGPPYAQGTTWPQHASSSTGY